MAAKTTVPITPAVLPDYDAWCKLVDLHEAYDKHTYPAAKSGEWEPVAQCTSCGWVKTYYNSGLEKNIPSLLVDSMLPYLMAPTGKYMLRRLMPSVNAFRSNKFYDLGRLFKGLSMDTLKYLFDTTAAPWAALALAGKTGSNLAAYRAACLTLPYTALEFGRMQGKPNDEERRAACMDPDVADLYADHVDKEYHVVTRKSAMRKPSSAVSYLRSWGTDFTLTDAERKRVCRTKYGASTAAFAELKDRPVYRKALGCSQQYGDRYIYNIAGQRCADMELGCRVDRGYGLVVYLACFDIDLESIANRWAGQTPYSRQLAGKVYDAMLTCKDLIGHLGKLEPGDIATMPYKIRSAMACGYVMATRSCDDVVWNALKKNRSYRWMVRSLEARVAEANVARLRQGMPLISSNF